MISPELKAKLLTRHPTEEMCEAIDAINAAEARIAKLEAALRTSADALDSLWAAIGDALCSGKGIEKAYSQGVATECGKASGIARAGLEKP